MKQLDDQLLGQYLDGVLDSRTVSDVADQLSMDVGAQERLVHLVAVQAKLRALGKDIMEEEIPVGLLDILQNKSARFHGIRMWSSDMLRYAAVLCLLVVGFIFGRTIGGERETIESTLFPTIPLALEQVVNTTLEFEPSGSKQVWEDHQKKYHAQIVPVRTYKGAEGDFYRMYYLELVRGMDSRLYVGIALRTGDKTWQTRSVYLRDGPMGI